MAAMTTCSLYFLVVAFVMGFTFFQTITGPGRNLSFCQFLLRYPIYENLYSLLSKAAYVSVFVQGEIKTQRKGLSCRFL